MILLPIIFSTLVYFFLSLNKIKKLNPYIEELRRQREHKDILMKLAEEKSDKEDVEVLYEGAENRLKERTLWLGYDLSPAFVNYLIPKVHFTAYDISEQVINISINHEKNVEFVSGDQQINIDSLFNFRQVEDHRPILLCNAVNDAVRGLRLLNPLLTRTRGKLVTVQQDASIPAGKLRSENNINEDVQNYIIGNAGCNHPHFVGAVNNATPVRFSNDKLIGWVYGPKEGYEQYSFTVYDYDLGDKISPRKYSSDTMPIYLSNVYGCFNYSSTTFWGNFKQHLTDIYRRTPKAVLDVAFEERLHYHNPLPWNAIELNDITSTTPDSQIRCNSETLNYLKVLSPKSDYILQDCKIPSKGLVHREDYDLPKTGILVHQSVRSEFDKLVNDNRMSAELACSIALYLQAIRISDYLQYVFDQTFQSTGVSVEIIVTQEVNSRLSLITEDVKDYSIGYVDTEKLKDALSFHLMTRRLRGVRIFVPEKRVADLKKAVVAASGDFITQAQFDKSKSETHLNASLIDFALITRTSILESKPLELKSFLTEMNFNYKSD